MNKIPLLQSLLITLSSQCVRTKCRHGICRQLYMNYSWFIFQKKPKLRQQQFDQTMNTEEQIGLPWIRSLIRTEQGKFSAKFYEKEINYSPNISMHLWKSPRLMLYIYFFLFLCFLTTYFGWTFTESALWADSNSLQVLQPASLSYIYISQFFIMSLSI